MGAPLPAVFLQQIQGPGAVRLHHRIIAGLLQSPGKMLNDPYLDEPVVLIGIINSVHPLLVKLCRLVRLSPVQEAGSQLLQLVKSFLLR